MSTSDVRGTASRPVATGPASGGSRAGRGKDGDGNAFAQMLAGSTVSAGAATDDAPAPVAAARGVTARAGTRAEPAPADPPADPAAIPAAGSTDATDAGGTPALLAQLNALAGLRAGTARPTDKPAQVPGTGKATTDTRAADTGDTPADSLAAVKDSATDRARPADDGAATPDPNASLLAQRLALAGQDGRQPDPPAPPGPADATAGSSPANARDPATLTASPANHPDAAAAGPAPAVSGEALDRALAALAPATGADRADRTDRAAPAATAPAFADGLAAALAPAGPAATAAPAAPAAPLTAGAELSAPVGTDAWGRQLAGQVTRWTLDGIDVAELTLNPKDLGPIHVEIALVEGKAAVHFAAEQAETRAAIDSQMFRLGDSLAGAGITLQSGTSGFESQGQAFGFMREQDRDGGSRGGNAAGTGRGSDAEPGDIAAPAAARPAATRRGALDLFA